jgi:hypothetical protein
MFSEDYLARLFDPKQKIIAPSLPFITVVVFLGFPEPKFVAEAFRFNLTKYKLLPAL